MPAYNLIDSSLAKWMAARMPRALKKVKEEGGAEAITVYREPRTKITFPGVTMPRQGGPNWDEFDRQVDTDEACIVIDGNIEILLGDFLAGVPDVSEGRSRLDPQTVQLGTSFWVDPRRSMMFRDHWDKSALELVVMALACPAVIVEPVDALDEKQYTLDLDEMAFGYWVDSCGG